MSRLECFLDEDSDTADCCMCFAEQSDCTGCSFAIGKKIIDDQNVIVFFQSLIIC